MRGKRFMIGLSALAVTGLLAGCGGGDADPATSASPSASPSPQNTAPLIGGESQTPIVIPSEDVQPSGLPPVPTETVQVSWTASQGVGGYEESWPVGVMAPGEVAYVKMKLPADATFEEVSSRATSVTGNQPPLPPSVVLVNLPPDATCDEAYVTSVKPKNRIVSVVDEERTADVANPKPTGEYVCAMLTLPQDGIYSQVMTTLSLSWSTPEWTNRNEWFATTFNVLGAAVNVD